MQNRRPKRITKLRGRRTAGYGRIKGHRASGQRGGKGNAGSKKHHYIKVMMENPRYFGKWGFKRPAKLVEEVRIMNIGDIDQMVDRLVERGIATKKGARYVVDVAKLGVDKILGGGKVKHKLDLTGVKYISESAKTKVTEVGGTLDIPVA